MITPENLPHEEAEFALFLRRKGDLAHRLRSLPQPQPSVELDAAILSKVQRALAASARAAYEAGEFQTGSARSLFRRSWPAQVGIALIVIAAAFITLKCQGRADPDVHSGAPASAPVAPARSDR